jgi:hypothetical protein
MKAQTSVKATGCSQPKPCPCGLDLSVRIAIAVDICL